MSICVYVYVCVCVCRFPDPDAKVAATVRFQALTRALQEIQERIENGYVQA